MSKQNADALPRLAMRRLLLALCALLWSLSIYAQVSSGVKPAASQTKTLSPPASPTVAQTAQQGQSTVSTPSVEQFGSALDRTEIFGRLRSIEEALSKVSQKLSSPDYTPAWIAAGMGFLGVLIGGWLSRLTQSQLIKHQKELADGAATKDRDLAKSRASFEIGSAMVQWKLKQLSELYGPLRALLIQSNAMYRNMNDVLVNREPTKFRLREGASGDDFDDKVFEIFVAGSWTRFRTVLHLPEVYGRGYAIEEYFDEVVAIGGQMVKVISEKAGYARPDQPALLDVFGKYLAHFSVLQQLHSQMKAKVAAREGDQRDAKIIPVVASAVFPAEIQGLVDRGLDATNRELDEWSSKALQ